MVEGSSAVNTSQQLEVQDVQRTRPTPERRQGSGDVQARGSSGPRGVSRADLGQGNGEE